MIVVSLLMAVGAARADFTIGEPVILGPTVNTFAAAYYNSLSADGLELYFCSQNDIWVTTRASVDDAWGEASKLGFQVNSPTYDGNPCLSADGLSLYFDSMRSGGHGPSDIWVTRRASINDAWGAAENLGTPVNSSEDEGFPAISSDGLELYFCDFDPIKPGGQGGRDLWMSKRSSVSEPWQAPVNVGPIVNSSAHDVMPSLSADGLVLLFTSRRPGGHDSRDIWMSRRSTINDPWTEPVNLGPSINTSANDQSATLSADGSMLYFTSARPGGPGNLNIWQAPVLPKVDFTGDGRIDFEDLVLLIEHWGQDESAYDMGPTPWGDGVVDDADLEVLMRHWGQDDNFVAHWKLDETGGDIAYDSVNENHAAVMGEPMWQREMGQLEGALQFDGVDDYLAAPFILDPTKQPFSVFAWIKGGQPGQTIISQQGGFGAWLSVDSAGALATGLTFPMPAVTSDVVITDDQWHRVGLVSDGAGMSLYVGSIEVARTPTSPILPANGDLQIGAGKNLEPDAFWEGLVDDVRIYDRVVEP